MLSIIIGKFGMEGRDGRGIELRRPSSSPFSPFCQLQIPSQMSNALIELTEEPTLALLFASTSDMPQWLTRPRKITAGKQLQMSGNCSLWRPRPTTLRIFELAMYGCTLREGSLEERTDRGEFVHRNPVPPLRVHSLASALKCTKTLLM